MATPVPLALYCFIGFVVLAYIVVSLLLRSMRVQYPALYAQLGEPAFSTILSRYPGHFKGQSRFMWCILSGRAWRETRGMTRALGGVLWLVYAGLFATLLGLGFAIMGA